MIRWNEDIVIYLHREPVDFRKQINGLAVVVQDEMLLSVFDTAIFVFCNKKRSQLKVLYWDKTGFVLWQKRLEKDKFKWPRKADGQTTTLTNEQWLWLLRGLDYSKIKPHARLNYEHIS